jgi:hypothetical protein
VSIALGDRKLARMGVRFVRRPGGMREVVARLVDYGRMGRLLKSADGLGIELRARGGRHGIGLPAGVGIGAGREGAAEIVGGRKPSRGA